MTRGFSFSKFYILFGATLLCLRTESAHSFHTKFILRRMKELRCKYSDEFRYQALNRTPDFRNLITYYLNEGITEKTLPEKIINDFCIHKDGEMQAYGKTYNVEKYNREDRRFISLSVLKAVKNVADQERAANNASPIHQAQPMSFDSNPLGAANTPAKRAANCSEGWQKTYVEDFAIQIAVAFSMIYTWAELGGVPKNPLQLIDGHLDSIERKLKPYEDAYNVSKYGAAYIFVSLLRTTDYTMTSAVRMLAKTRKILRSQCSDPHNRESSVLEKAVELIRGYASDEFDVSLKKILQSEWEVAGDELPSIDL